VESMSILPGVEFPEPISNPENAAPDLPFAAA
jgi:hypothetical protein